MSIPIHEDWDTAGFDLPPAAAGTGPFAGRAFLETWWRLRGTGRLALAEPPGALFALVMNEGSLEFAGEPDLTDYHSPLGTDIAMAARQLAASLPQATRMSLDSLPAETATPLAEGLQAGGWAVSREPHEVTAVITLPADSDVWYGSLAKKQRHELRRKLRRFEAEMGDPVVDRTTSRASVARFAAMHRKAGGDKGSFMTAEMERWFAALVEDVGAFCDVLTAPGGEPLAAAVGFEDDRGYYLYNSAYDPEAGHLSPGIVLLAVLIERAIAGAMDIFDFLKGDEAYKFQLGAEPRALYRVTARGDAS